MNDTHTTLSRALRDAVSDRLLARNPATGAHQQPESPEQETWNAEQLTEFLELVEGYRLYAMWRLLALTGMRRGEIVGLRRRDLDFDNARLFVVQQRAKGGGIPARQRAAADALSSSTARPSRRCGRT